MAGMERDMDKGFPGGNAGGRCGRILVHGGGLRLGLRGQARHWGGGRQGAGTERSFGWNDDYKSCRAVAQLDRKSVGKGTSVEVGVDNGGRRVNKERSTTKSKVVKNI